MIRSLVSSPKKTIHQQIFGKWLKKEVREIEDDAGVLIVDDTVQEKPHSKENSTSKLSKPSF
jgi:hypothetical protein